MYVSLYGYSLAMLLIGGRLISVGAFRAQIAGSLIMFFGVVLVTLPPILTAADLRSERDHIEMRERADRLTRYAK